MDALNLAGPVNLELIHLDDPRERAYWAHVLSLSEDELEQVVDTVGPRAIDVRRHLAHARHAEWQRRAHQSHHRMAPKTRASTGGLVFGLIVFGAAAAATMFGALAYGLMPPDEWMGFQRERTFVRTNLAGAVDSAEPKPARCVDATDARHTCRRDRSEWPTIWEKYPKHGEPADDAKSEP